MRTSEIVAIKGGGDWYDASVEIIKIPLEIDLDKAKLEWRAWYTNDYLVPYRAGQEPEYLRFNDWLIEYKGATPALDTDVEVYEEP